MRKLALGLVVLLVALAALVITPYAFWNPFEPSFEFGAVEMCNAVEGKWVVELTPKQGPARTLHVVVEQASAPQQSSARGLIQPAAACGGRTLVKSAAACVSSTQMLLVIESDEATAIAGELLVHGSTFDEAHLVLTFENEPVVTDYGNDKRTITADLDPDGTVSSAWTNDGKVTLKRIGRLSSK